MPDPHPSENSKNETNEKLPYEGPGSEVQGGQEPPAVILGTLVKRNILPDPSF